ncbi:hypothetical protein [Erwinia sp.]|nr:hypothetical protein [Erwinia sp.]
MEKLEAELAAFSHDEVVGDVLTNSSTYIGSGATQNAGRDRSDTGH